jgi:F-type H+-transporting ATPase subunit b
MRIDWWTLALQAVNVLVLVWILGRFFFRPVSEIVAKRREAANKLLADAAADRRAAAELHEAAEKARAEIDAQRESLIAQAHEDARAEKGRLLAELSQEAAKAREAAQAAIARERAAAEQAIVAHASELAVEIARRLLARQGGNGAVEPFLPGLCDTARTLTQEARESLAEATPDEPLEVVTATALSPGEADQVRAALAKTFGATVPLAFRSDPTLLAGIELHGGNAILRNCWREDLDRIREELSRDKHQP